MKAVRSTYLKVALSSVSRKVLGSSTFYFILQRYLFAASILHSGFKTSFSFDSFLRPSLFHRVE